MAELKLYIPKLEELHFRQTLLSDPETMAYNKGYELDCAEYHNDTGCMDFPQENWQSWYNWWVGNEPEWFYAYLINEDGEFVGDVNFHKAGEDYCIGIVIYAKYRGRKYCQKGLELLKDKARELCIKKLMNDFEFSRKAAMKGHIAAGFLPVGAHDNCCILEVEL